ncbi:putative gustatory receptor clone PTE03 isoform X2 [Betta splendens]|uniref:Olfactory receptor n=1 Tax=Betta splendens TaxID=158456 RepID=A0A6P7P7R1_BETSP|nr:putative gustatory receptor clone PTE03 isoform X2 [Betta splendens]
MVMNQGLNDSQTNRRLFLTFALMSYLITVFINLMLITTICLEKGLHEPIYLFLCNLCFNGICGASSFYPKLLHDLLLDSYVITYTGCLTQVFVVYSYVFCDFTTLSVMAYDRYLAICRPLQYHSLMTGHKVAQLLLLSWSFSLLETLLAVIMTSQLTICSRQLHKLFCTNWEVVKLSCSNTTGNNVYGYVVMFLQLSQMGFILVSYTRLVRASLQSRSNRTKFVQTCLPHLVTLLVFTSSLLFDTLYSRYGSSSLVTLQNVLAVWFLVVPPLLNPIIYGINLRQVRYRIVHKFTRRLSLNQPEAGLRFPHRSVS